MQPVATFLTEELATRDPAAWRGYKNFTEESSVDFFLESLTRLFSFHSAKMKLVIEISLEKVRHWTALELTQLNFETKRKEKAGF